MKIVIQSSDFDVGDELLQLRKAHRQTGAIVSFVGTVRDAVRADELNQPVLQMELEHYPGMTEKSLTNIAQQAFRRWQLNDVVIIHRVGVLTVSEQIVLVAVASQHRDTAFLACEFIMDYLKTEAPFWKKETGEHGSEWVDARSTDVSALEKWK